uniref:Uncharacterized protein n=1 Tax=Anguilla anguilla TaxID=7936 RepID=A0A0E9UTP5_ANGAN
MVNAAFNRRLESFAAVYELHDDKRTF